MTIENEKKHSVGLRVLVMGYYGHLNAGDDLLQQAMAYIFKDHKIMFTSWFPGVNVLNECDLVVVGGGSIWPGFAIFRNAEAITKRLKVPIFILGISAKNKDAQVKAETQKMIERSLFFHVRDSSTKEILGGGEKVRVGADLFWWLPWEEGDIPKCFDNSIALNIREWKAESWVPASIVDCISSCGMNIKGLPFYFGSKIHDSNIELNDVELLQSLGVSNFPNHFSYQNIVKSRLTIAMRYHAILLSVRLGRPAIGFDYHPKVKSIFTENEMGELCVSLNDMKGLENAIRLVNDNYERYCKKFNAVKEKMEYLALEDYKACSSVLKTIKPRQQDSILRRATKSLLLRL